MATNMNALPADPLAEKEAPEKPPAKPKRKRRNKAQIAADKEAVALGFKDAADRAEQEATMGEAKDSEHCLAEGAPHAPEPAAEVGAALQGIANSADEQEHTAELIQPGLPIGSHWNLGGHSFTVMYSDKDTVLFKK
jgi:hypothetical protein